MEAYNFNIVNRGKGFIMLHLVRVVKRKFNETRSKCWHLSFTVIVITVKFLDASCESQFLSFNEQTNKQTNNFHKELVKIKLQIESQA